MMIFSKKLLKIILNSLLLLFCTALHAQEYIAHVKKIGMEDGLSSYNISSTFQDSDGYIWISTDYGLNRYDGSAIKTYTKEESGLCYNDVRHVLEDKRKMLWVFTPERGGNWNYCIFDRRKEQFYSLEDYLGEKPPFDIKKTTISEHKGIIYFCEEKEPNARLLNFYEYNGEKVRKLFSLNREHPLIRFKYIGGLIKEGDNRYNIFMNAGNNLIESLVLGLDNKGNIIESYYCDKEHSGMLGVVSNQQNVCIFCVSSKGGYDFLDIHTNRERPQKQDIRIKSAWGERIGIYQDNTYILNADSLKIYNKEGFLVSKIYLGLSLKTPFSAFVMMDRDGNIWFPDQEHLYCISPEKKRFEVELQHPETPIRLRGIAINAEGDLYTGTVALLLEQQKQKDWQGTPISNNVLGILIKDSTLWYGTENYQINRFNSKTKQLEAFFIKSGEKTLSPLIWMPFVSADGQVWAGGNKGLYRLDEKNKYLVSFQDTALNGTAVYAFHENKAGTWLSTSSGLFLVDLKQEKVLKHYSKNKKGNNYIPAEHIAHLHEDKAGIFWLASKGEGLIRWNPKTGESRQYTQKKDGLSHNVLYSVYGDDFGNLWISSQRGLMRFHKETAGINIYLKEEGLPNNEFNTISHYQAPDGSLYFGGQNGMIHFHPKNFEDNKKQPPFLISEYSKQSQGTDSLQNLTADFLKNPLIIIAPGDRSVILKLSLLDYRNSENHLYSYWIEGYDNNWNYQTENQIKLNGLPYGTYKLKIRAKNANASNWTDYPEIITIRVLRPFYLQLWFIVLMLVLIAAAIYAAVHWRIQKLEEGKAELEKIVKERTQIIENDKSLIEQQSAELRSLDELKTKFFANISHELRTPLTLILGPLSYILDSPDEWEKETIKEQLLVMRRNGKSLMGLIEEILDLSKLEANKLDLQEEPTPIVQLLEYIFAVFEPQFQIQKLDYELVVNLKDDNLTILVDRKKLEKVVNNFLSNATKFTGSDGKITLSLQEEDTIMKICVCDTGKGVHPNDLPFIFERFYQSKQADQKLYGGTGIGLALVSDFAKLMDGKAYAESTLGEGSRFYFELPKKVVAVGEMNLYPVGEEKIEEDLIEHIGYDFTILVVEDNKDMRDFVCRLLQKQYKTVLTAHNGVEGLQVLKTHGADIHLIVSDVMMPEMDGLTMLKEIKSSPEWMGIPVVMLTALAAERDKLTALTIGVDDYLTKPFSVNELLIRTQNLLYNYHQRLQLKTESVEAEIIPIIAEASDNEWIKNAEKAVKNSIKNQILDVEGLAAALFIGSRQLSRKISAITGLSTSKFIREVQLQAALKDLEDGKALSIAEVSINNGFEQVSTFSKLFKKRFGKNPSEYLKNSI